MKSIYQLLNACTTSSVRLINSKIVQFRPKSWKIRNLQNLLTCMQQDHDPPTYSIFSLTCEYCLHLDSLKNWMLNVTRMVDFAHFFKI